jgi:hypothetical protein
MKARKTNRVVSFTYLITLREEYKVCVMELECVMIHCKLHQQITYGKSIGILTVRACWHDIVFSNDVNVHRFKDKFLLIVNICFLVNCSNSVNIGVRIRRLEKQTVWSHLLI